MRRLPLTAVALALLVPAAPARAQLAVTTVEFVFGPGGAVEDRTLSPPPGSVVSGRWQIRVRAVSSGTLERISLRLEAEDVGLQPAGAQPAPKSFPLLSGVKENELVIDWDTATTAARNGSYRWVAEASSHLGEIKTAVLSGLKVNNPPEPPGQVEVQLDGATPVVTWGVAAEPDVVGWRVWRAPEGIEYHEPVGTVETREFRDQGAPPGPQTYEVNAVRRSPVTPRGIPSQLSARTAAVVVPGVVVAPPTPAALPSPLPAVQGGPQSSGTFNPELPYATPAPAPEAPPPATEPAAEPQAVPAAAPAVQAADRLRFVGAGVLLLTVALLAWRLRHKLVTGR
jgi:hypothetical protein